MYRVFTIAAELLNFVERAVSDTKKEGKLWVREGNFDWYIFKNRYIIYCWIHGDLFFLFLRPPKKWVYVIKLCIFLSIFLCRPLKNTIRGSAYSVFQKYWHVKYEICVK